MKKSKTIVASTMMAGAFVAQSTIGNAQTAPAGTSTSTETIRPFQVHIPDSELVDLRKRIVAPRWPDKETVTDESQGVQLKTMQELISYWATDYDWRKFEAKINALPQFVTTIDSVDIHFIHVKSKEKNALPVIITHGWPGSFIEELKLIGPLTDPVAYGGKPEDAFDVVIPSMPGYGFSGKPTAPGWGVEHIARAWDNLMHRLGYTRYVAQGGDWGARISEVLAHLAPKGLLGIHTNLLLTIPPEIVRASALGEPAPADLPEDEKFAYNQRKGRGLPGYYVEQASRPQTIGYSLAESPVGLAAWLIDHDPRTHDFMAQAIAGHPDGELTKDEILDNITLYWLTNTGTSAARLYWESGRTVLSGEATVPAAFTVFPNETTRVPKSWVKRAYPNLIYFHEVDKGGHFAAWEQPQLFAEEMRAAFKSLR